MMIVSATPLNPLMMMLAVALGIGLTILGGEAVVMLRNAFARPDVP